MQNFNYKIILISIFLFCLTTNIYSAGKRKNFLSHGPSVSAFSQGETVLNNLTDPSITFYNSSLLSFFEYNNIELSRYNLFDGSSYNVASTNIELFNNFSIGFTAINLSSGDVEVRLNPFDKAKIINTNQWEYILALATQIKSIGVGVGLNVKYIYMDLYEKQDGCVALDLSLSKYFKNVDLKYTQATIGIGFSANNFYDTGIKLDTYREYFQNIFILSSMISIPTMVRFDSKDTFTLLFDIRNEDTYNDYYAGIEYKFMDRYAIRGGYYLEHITAGLGITLFDFIINYSIDFNEIDLIHRFSLDYRFAKNKNKRKDMLSDEAKLEYKINESKKKQAKTLFNKAKSYYSQKQYLYATEILKDLIVNYGNYEAPIYYYNKIQKSMKENSISMYDTSFLLYAYASGYINYYNGNYYEASKQWQKCLQFDKNNEEINEYYKKIKEILDQSLDEQKKKEFEQQASDMLNFGIELYNKNKWVSCIKQMEKLQAFVKQNNYASSLEYYTKAKYYINKSVTNLAKTLKEEQENNNTFSNENIIETDEITSNEKYKEGLVLYAKGKYLEAQQMWEVSLRLDPNNIKAKKALDHIKGQN